MKNLWKKFLEWITAKASPVVKPVEPVATTAWPAYDGHPGWAMHGNTIENDYRAAAIDAARASGLGAMRITCGAPPENDLAAWLFKFNGERGSYISNGDPNVGWYFRALAAGITRWVVDIGYSPDRARWKYIFKSYSDKEVQFIIDGGVVPWSKL